jgi:hypothetical protein
MVETTISNAQADFDARYISGREIRNRLGVAHCSLTFAHQRGDLPEPIIVGGGIHIWERAAIEPFLIEWARKLLAKRERSA